MAPRSTLAAAAAAALFAGAAQASIGFDCSDIVSQKVRWNLKELGGPRMVHWVRDIEPSVHNFTFTMDICKPLVKHKNEDPHNECPSNTRVCGVEYITDKYDHSSSIGEVVAIAGDYHLQKGQPLESEVFRMKDSGSNADSEKEGVRVELSGGRQPFTGKGGVKQKAIIEFLCDPNRDGKDTELDERPEDPDAKDPERRSLLRREEEEEDPQKKRALQFISYKDETLKGEDWGVLRLQWHTKYACEGAVDAPKEPGQSSGGWGFFTWLIIVLFLATAAYLVFGSWLNYNRYGARGWDALPHGDTIRDLPYIMQDFGRKVAGTVQGGGSRGGYSAV